MNLSQYLSLSFDLIQVDKKDRVVGKVERWLAHKDGILHRSFTCIIKANNQIVIQKRKHKVFNNVFDLTFSSHPLFLEHGPQNLEEAIKLNLKREWQIEGIIEDLKFLEKYTYKFQDEKSGFWENEVNYLYLLKIKGKISNNPEFSYGMDILNQEVLLRKFKQFNFAPWVKEISLKKIQKYLQM